MSTIPKYVTLEELSSVIHVKPQTIRNWVKNGLLPPAALLQLGRTHRYDLDLVLAAMRAKQPIPLYTSDGVNHDDSD
jgi:hypothetical protein